MSLEHIAKLDGKKLWKTMWSCPKDLGLNLKESPMVHSQENLELNKRTIAKGWIHKVSSDSRSRLRSVLHWIGENRLIILKDRK